MQRYRFFLYLQIFFKIFSVFFMKPQERIAKLLNIYNLNAKTFSEKLGFDRPQAIYDILSGKTMAISEKMAIKIISVFPEVEKAWLLTGEGNVLNTVKLATDTVKTPVEEELENAKRVIYELNMEILHLKDRIAALEGKGNIASNVG